MAPVDVEMGVRQKGQAVQQQVLECLGGPAFLFPTPGEDLRLVGIEHLCPAQIVVRAIEGREGAEQVLHIPGRLVGGDDGVRVKGLGPVLPDLVLLQRGLVRGLPQIAAPIHGFLLHALMFGVHPGQQLFQCGLLELRRGGATGHQNTQDHAQ